MSESFVEFIENINARPGIVLEHLHLFVGGYEQNEKIVGRNESLREDLAAALKKYSIDFDEEVIATYPPVHVKKEW